MCVWHVSAELLRYGVVQWSVESKRGVCVRVYTVNMLSIPHLPYMYMLNTHATHVSAGIGCVCVV